MPKRSSSERLEYYQAKIRKLQRKQRPPSPAPPRRRRCIVYSDSSNSDDDTAIAIETTAEVHVANDDSTESVPLVTEQEILITDSPSVDQPLAPEADTVKESEPDLDADFLSALGEAADDSPPYGEKIHQTLADRWLPILRRGISKEVKEKLLKEQLIPENCQLLKAPTLNPEISAAITEAARNKDKKLENAQQQLGLGITAVNRAMSILFTGDDKQSKVQAVKILLSDACRILTDLHFMDTQTRIKLITPALDKAFLTIIQDLERDESLFGSKLSEKIKASKTIEKQGLQIKKNVTSQKAPTPSTSQSTTRTRIQGNWTAPFSRYQPPSNRGGRGGVQKILASAHKPAHQTVTPAKSGQGKPRAPPRH